MCPDGPRFDGPRLGTLLGILPDISIVPRLRDERLNTDIQAVRQRSICNHFILKVILRNGPNLGNPTLFRQPFF
jgi:hypothetical protein